MWLTRTYKPFAFNNEYDSKLSFENCEKLGLYVHIPFCRKICNFCPYCKEIYNEDKCNRYIDALIREINLVGSTLSGKKKVTSLYFGGGTPSLALNRLFEIISEIKKYFIITDEIGVELHPENVCYETLSALKEAGVTAISIGIQSFCDKFSSILGRVAPDPNVLAAELAKVHFDTVSMDFIFALPGQTSEDLKYDINTAFSCGANHIAIYPFIDFTFTSSPVSAMKKSDKRNLLDELTIYLENTGCRRDSIWTFSNDKTSKYSSMTRENFLGFGCSAATLLENQFKINTFSTEEYINRINGKKLPTSLTLRFTKHQRMVYYLFWTLYSTTLSEKEFEEFFGKPLKKVYGFELFLAEKLGFLTKKDDIYKMTLKGAFYYHYYENYYTLSYIDKMWGVMRKEAFPKKIVL